MKSKILISTIFTLVLVPFFARFILSLAGRIPISALPMAELIPLQDASIPTQILIGMVVVVGGILYLAPIFQEQIDTGQI